MQEAAFYDRVQVETSTTGTGESVAVGSAVTGYLTPAEAGVQDSAVVNYVIEDGDDFEFQIGQTYSSSGPALSRGTPSLSKISGTVGTSQIELSGSARVGIVPFARQLNAKAGIVDAEQLITVGTGGNFSTINEALAFASKKYAIYANLGLTVEVKLLTGFTMAEQVNIVNKDLSWITLTSEDAEVTIIRSALSQQFFGDGGAAQSAAAFNVVNGGLPTIGVLFNMDSSGDATNRHGIFLHRCSHGVIERTKGVKNAGSRGLYVNNSTCYARETVWDGAGTHGIRVSNASKVYCIESSATNCGEAGIYVQGGHVDAESCVFTGAGTRGADIRDHSVVRLASANLSNATGNCLYVTGGAVVCARSATCTGAGDRGIQAEHGATVDAQGADASGATTAGINADAGSRVNARNANAQMGESPGSNDMRVFNGSIIAAAGATGGTNVTVNTLTANGIIFQ